MVHKSKRRYSNEFKAQAVELVRTSGKGVTEVARDLGIAISVLSRWVVKADDAAARTPEESAELKRLRKEVERLTMERDFLKKAAAFFAKESK